MNCVSRMSGVRMYMAVARDSVHCVSWPLGTLVRSKLTVLVSRTLRCAGHCCCVGGVGVAQLLSLTSHWSWWHHSSTPQHRVPLSSCLSSIGPALLLLTTQWLLVTLPEAQSTGSILIAEDLYTNPNKPKKINWIKQNNAWHFVSISGLTGLGLWLISSHFCHYSKVQ